jgi:predicted Rossmann-fold nucleotide-binding protein
MVQPYAELSARIAGSAETGMRVSLVGELAAPVRVRFRGNALSFDLEEPPRFLARASAPEDMRTRKHEMLTRAEAVVALAGGTGTLEELLEALTLKRLGLFLGPIVVVNTDGYYDPLLAQFRAAIDGRFMDERHDEMWKVVPDPEGVLPAIMASPQWNAGNRDFAVAR